MQNSITIDLPENVDLSPDVLEDKGNMRDALAAVLYKQGKITAVQARTMMGVPRRSFEDRLVSFGFSMMDESDFADELDAAKTLAQQI